MNAVFNKLVRSIWHDGCGFLVSHKLRPDCFTVSSTCQSYIHMSLLSYVVDDRYRCSMHIMTVWQTNSNYVLSDDVVA